ncbi:hypothetical protein AB0F64_36135 [Streptomyces sp. NPDC026294]|uniref:hypothetical protein n=1 Tax=Streptomyces sp. NPDC026294 TaxID=3155362 RepID=UPI0034013B8C
MPSRARYVPISTFVGAAAMLTVCATGCGSTQPASPSTDDSRPAVVSAGGTETSGPRSSSPSAATGNEVPAAVATVARTFTTAYAQHDARDGHDRSYADAGVRAAKYASGELVDILAQKRPSQDAPWAALRDEQARTTVEITSVRVPDGAPAPTPGTALVRVAYTLSTTPVSGPARKSSEQLALRLENTSDGWRVTALPWA